MEAEIPDKIYLKIGEVSELTTLRPSVLRYWESEFARLRPLKSRSGQRLYTRSDVELVMEIKRLLYTEKLTVEGARRRLKAGGRGGEAVPPAEAGIDAEKRSLLKEVMDELQSLRDSL